MRTLSTGLGEAFVGYRLINCDKASLSLFAGARYTYLEGDLSIFNNGDARLVILRRLLGIRNKLDFSASTDWVDPVLGARGKVKIWKATSLYAQGDVGGFDANSGSAFEVHREGRTTRKNSGIKRGLELPSAGRPRISTEPVVLDAGRLALSEVRLCEKRLYE